MDYLLTEVPGIAVGEVAGVDDKGRPQVRCGESAVPRTASVVWLPVAPDWSASVGARVVVAYENGDEDQPIIIGLLDAPRTMREAKPRTLRIESERELIIECGKSKIALRADGRIEIRGGHLVSRSTGPNKVKGASIHIN